MIRFKEVPVIGGKPYIQFSNSPGGTTKTSVSEAFLGFWGFWVFRGCGTGSVEREPMQEILLFMAEQKGWPVYIYHEKDQW